MSGSAAPTCARSRPTSRSGSSTARARSTCCSTSTTARPASGTSPSSRETADSMVLLAPRPSRPRASSDASSTASWSRHVVAAGGPSKLVAVTAAAAIILSVVAVRIVDQNRTPSSTAAAAAAVETVSMVGDNGQNGRQGRRRLQRQATMALDLSVAYTLPDGDYSIVLDPVGRAQGATRHGARRRRHRAPGPARPTAAGGRASSRWSTPLTGRTRCTARAADRLTARLLQPFGEEREHLVERVAGRVAGLVDEVLGEHRVRGPRDAVRVARSTSRSRPR